MEASSKVREFKEKLRTLITELLTEKEKERVSSAQVETWKAGGGGDEEAELLRRKIVALEASSIQLQRKVHFLEHENLLLQTNLKQLNHTIDTILQAKQAFLNAYQDSTCQMKTSRDTKIAMLSDELDAHLLLFDSIRKEASFVNQLVQDAHHLLNHREEAVARLKMQMDQLLEFQALLIEKNNDREVKLKSNEDEFHRKDRVISELQTQLKTAKVTHQCRSKIEELQEDVLMKEGIIETLISENKALRSELGMLEVSFKIVQDTMTHMDEEDRVAYLQIFANQEKDATENDREDDRLNHNIEHCEANSHHDASRATVAEIADSPCKAHAHTAIPLRENNNVHSCVSESPFSP